MKKYLISSLFLASSLFATNNDVHININNDTLEVGTEVFLNNLYDVDNSSNYYLDISYLKTEGYEDDPTLTLNTMGVKVMNPFENEYNIQFGLGIKSVYSNQFDKKFFSLPLALYMKYLVSDQIYINADASYAPRVLSYYSADNFTDFRVEANYKLVENGYIFVGARSITAKYTMYGNIDYDKAMFVGYKIKF